MGKLKDDMISNMIIRGYSSKTIKTYTSCVKTFANYFRKSPLLVSREEIYSFFLSLRGNNKSDSTIHMYYEALKYFYSIHGLSTAMPQISFSKRKRPLPEILSRKEVLSLLEKCASMKLKTILSLIYSSGLRISEATGLVLSDLDFDRNIIHIRNSKNGKDRYTILSRNSARLVLDYLNVYKPSSYLFFRLRDPSKSISESFIQRNFKDLLRKAGIDKSAHVHTLRHCFATHLLENGTSLFHIMHLLGHSSIQTTMIYLHLQTVDLSRITSPFDLSTIGMELPKAASAGDLFLQSA